MSWAGAKVSGSKAVLAKAVVALLGEEHLSALREMCSTQNEDDGINAARQYLAEVCVVAMTPHHERLRISSCAVREWSN